SKYFINGINSKYSQETSFNKVNIVNAIFTYADGLYLNATLSSGIYTNKLINSTIGAGYEILQYSYNISFNKSFYSLYDVINFSYHIMDNSTTHNTYYIKTIQTEKSTGNYYTNSYQVNPDVVGYYDSSGYILPIVYANMISDFQACVMQNNIATYCKSVNYGYLSDLNVSITGNLSLDKNTYNQSEIVQITYNSSVNGRIKIMNGFKELMNQEILSGNNQKLNYTNNYLDIGQYIVSLEYQLNGSWIILNSKQYTTISQNNLVWFEKETIEQGNNIKIFHIINQSGYLILKDSSNNQIFNYNLLTSNGFTIQNNYNVLYTDLSGIWNIYLYNSSMNQLSTDNITVNMGISITPTATATTTPSSLIDISNQISKEVFGEIGKDDKGKISEQGISDMGDKIFMTLLLFV
ncbi:MAG: hypothetical protein Q7T55_14145, partial [Solirubrobacteraceae bacterium]|nr:hypothetical protein [Solirubrobacteraceae bacterium]